MKTTTIDEAEALDMATFAAVAVVLYAISAGLYVAGEVQTAALFAALGFVATAIMVGAAVNAVRGRMA